MVVAIFIINYYSLLVLDGQQCFYKAIKLFQKKSNHTYKEKNEGKDQSKSNLLCIYIAVG